MKIYIAAPYEIRNLAIAAMTALELRGHIVTSRWLREEMDLSEPSANADLVDVAAADALLLLHPETWHNKGSGGRHVEMGYALGLGKQIVILGQRSNVFHYLQGVRLIETLGEL